MTEQETLAPLVERVLELAARPEEEAKKELWARHNALEPTPKIPVLVTYEGIPGPQWDAILGAGGLRCVSGPARRIELQLRKIIWAAENVPDDRVVWPALLLPAVAAGAPDWGVPLGWRQSGDELGAKLFDPPFAGGIELARLRPAQTEINEPATAERLERAAALTGARLAVGALYPKLPDAPFDFAVHMRGMENIFLDVFDAPEQLRRLMEFITEAIAADHRRREARGWINCPADPTGRWQMVATWRHVAARLPAGLGARRPRIADEWAYVTAQTASGLGPEQYAEFVHPYNARLAALYDAGTVYYHGCECLDQKLASISTLPNLRRHHVSPWSSLRLAAEHYRNAVNLEVHSHPGKVFFGWTRADIRGELDGLVAAAGGHRMNLNLSDIHTVNGNPGTLRVWAEEAQRAAGKA